MEIRQKQILIMTGAFIIGLVFVLSGITNSMHDFIARGIKENVWIEQYAKEKTSLIAESIAYTIEIIMAGIMLLSPICVLSGMWYMLIAYELVIGKNAGLNIFIISPYLNYVMAFLCLLLFFYSLYLQYNWSVKIANPEPKKPKDELSRFI